jgi:hypothetical protein
VSARGVAPPNHTQTPNELLDEVLPEIDSLAELKVTLAIVRQTFGWHREAKVLSITRLEALTGLSHRHAVEGARRAVDRGYVQREQVGNSHAYSLRVASSQREPAPVPNGNGQETLAGVPDGNSEKEKVNVNGGKKTAPAPNGAVDDRVEARRLCELLGQSAAERTGNDAYVRRSRSEGWIAAMDRLIRIDGRSPEAIERAIAWIHDHPFWRSNVLSAPKLREKFDTLLLQAEREKSQSTGRRSSGTIAGIRREDDTPYGSTVEHAQPYDADDHASATRADDA